MWAETVPASRNLASSSCSDDSPTRQLSAGESEICTFHNVREQGAILITKLRKHAASGPIDHPHADPPDPAPTNANGDGSLKTNNKEPGTYFCTIEVDP